MPITVIIRAKAWCLGRTWEILTYESLEIRDLDIFLNLQTKLRLTYETEGMNEFHTMLNSLDFILKALRRLQNVYRKVVRKSILHFRWIHPAVGSETDSRRGEPPATPASRGETTGTGTQIVAINTENYGIQGK